MLSISDIQGVLEQVNQVIVWMISSTNECLARLVALCRGRRVCSLGIYGPLWASLGLSWPP